MLFLSMNFKFGCFFWIFKLGTLNVVLCTMENIRESEKIQSNNFEWYYFEFIFFIFFFFGANSMNIISKTLTRRRCLPFPFMDWSLKNVNKIHRTMKFIFSSSNQFDNKSNVIKIQKKKQFQSNLSLPKSSNIFLSFCCEIIIYYRRTIEISEALRKC